MYKKLLLFTLSVMLSTQFIVAQTQPWQQGAFEIRVFDVEQGEVEGELDIEGDPEQKRNISAA